MTSQTSKLQNIQIGQQIRINYGAGIGEQYGKVSEYIVNRWGESLKVEMNDGTVEYVDSFVTAGIGAYLN